MKWRGHRAFDLSVWKLALKRNPTEAAPTTTSQLQDLTKHLCALLLDREVELVRDVLKRLKQTHSAFLHSLCWEDGSLSARLGHANPGKRADCMRSPAKDQVQSALLQLLPDWAQGLVTWEEPAPFDGEGRELEGGGLPAAPEPGEHFDSVSSVDLFASSQGSISPSDQGLMSESSTPQPSPTESEVGAQSSFPRSSSSNDSSNNNSELMKYLERQMEENRSGLQESMREAVKQLGLEQQRDLAARAQSHREEIEKQQRDLAARAQSHREEIEKLQQKSQASDSSISQMLQREKDEWVGRMGQQVSRMDAQLDEQRKLMADLHEKQELEKRAAAEEAKRAVQKLVEEMQGSQMRQIEEMRRQHNQDQMGIVEEMKTQLQVVTEEMNKQRRDMQVSTEEEV